MWQFTFFFEDDTLQGEVAKIVCTPCFEILSDIPYLRPRQLSCYAVIPVSHADASR